MTLLVQFDNVARCARRQIVRVRDIRLPSVLNAITFSVNRDVCVEHPIRIYVRIRHPDRIFCTDALYQLLGVQGLMAVLSTAEP